MTLYHSSTSFPRKISTIFGSLWMGTGTHVVPLELFKLNRERLCSRLKRIFKDRAFVFLEGGKAVPLYNTDVTYNVFRQESYFMWTFGVLEPGCYGAIDIQNGTTYLFVPRLTKLEMITWGFKNLDTFRTRYSMKNVLYCDEMTQFLCDLHPTQLLVLQGVNTDSGLPIKETYFPGIEGFTLETHKLFKEMTELRMIKTELEVDVMKYVIKITCDAHRKIMRYIKGGHKYEYQCESEFLHYCYSVGGCRHVSSTSMCASEENSSILNYGHGKAPNDRFILPGERCLFDMGASYFGYYADVACTIPVSGKFTHEHRLIYESVLAANMGVIKALKPGVCFINMYILGLRILLNELTDRNLLRGDPEQMLHEGLAAVFQPHGIGHLLGLDMHDVGGYPQGHRRGEPSAYRKLRMVRTLQEGMIVTVEPGCYFIDVLLDEAMEDPRLNQFLVLQEIKRFRGFGGVRIKDDVLITRDGAEVLSKMPRTVKEIERYMSGKDDKKYK